MPPNAADSPTPRGTRLPREARRAQLLQSALTVFVESGYHAAGMDEIADRASVSKPVLYQHFPGKLELYLALLDMACDQIMDAVRDALGSTTDSEGRVVATMDAYLDYVARNGGAYRLVFESDLRQEPQVAERVHRVQRETSKAIADLVTEQTGLSVAEARLVATGIVGMAETAARDWLGQGSAISQEDAARLLANLVWRGLRVLPVLEDSPAND